MDALSLLIASELRKPGNSLRVMEERARAAGHRMSRTQLNAYARGEVKKRPERAAVEALAAALGCPFPQVATAVDQAFDLGGPTPPERRRSQHAEAWLRLTDSRSNEEVEELLLIVEQVLRMRDLEGRGD